MDIVSALFTAWLSITASIIGHPVEIHSKAAFTDIQKAEQAIGQPLTDELRTLYMVANGQLIPDSDTVPNTYKPLFLKYGFHSLDEATELRQTLLSSADSGKFSTDWFPFASDGKGSGWAVDLGAIKEGSIGKLIAFGDATVNSHFTPTISSFMKRALAHLDPLHLHQLSDRQLLDNLGRWYFKHSKDLSRPAEVAYAEALRPWVLPSEKILYERPGNYPWLLAAHMDQHELCDGIGQFDIADGSRAVKLAHDWLLKIGRIGSSRHNKLEAIRLNLNGARDRLLEQTTRTMSNEGGYCQYMIDYKDLVR